MLPQKLSEFFLQDPITTRYNSDIKISISTNWVIRELTSCGIGGSIGVFAGSGAMPTRFAGG
jgi:flagellar biosynthesis/type III secretory pathway ATPase